MRQNRGRGAAVAYGLLTPRAVLVGVVAVAVLLGVVLAAREAGPIPIDERELFGGIDDTTATTAPALAEEPPAEQSDESENLLSEISMWYLIVVLLALALMFVLVLRALIAMRNAGADQGEKKPAPPPPDGVPWTDPTQNLQRAAARAEEALLAARPGNTKDAVIAAWMQLEQAATEAGSGRPAPATPHEFTVVLLKRYAVDADAMTALLDLYHRARFGRQALSLSAVDEALTAVRTIATGLGATRRGA